MMMRMPRIEHKEYYVLELINPPHSDDKYICVHRSWVNEVEDEVVAVNLSQTESQNWRLAHVKYSTDNYNHAKQYISMLNEISMQDRRYQPMVEQEMPTTSYKTMPEPSSGRLLQIDPALISNLAKPMNIHLQSKQTFAEVQMEDEPHSVNVYEHKKYSRKQTLQTTTANDTGIDFNLTIQDNSKPHDDTEARETLNQENTSSDNQNTKSRKAPINPLTFMSTVFLPVLKEIVIDSERCQEISQVMSLAFKRQSEILKKIIKVIETKPGSYEAVNSEVKGNDKGNRKVNKKTKERTQEQVEGQENDSVVEVIDETESKNSNDENKKQEHQRNIRGRARKFILPPEYDSNDSRWTLKHRENTDRLVELIPDSKVYVDSIRLNFCRLSSNKDSKKLARMLLTEVFSENALSICSWTGTRANAFDYNGKDDVRPGLDENARTALMNYVEKNARDRKWAKFDSPSVLHSMRSKIQEIRAKHKK